MTSLKAIASRCSLVTIALVSLQLCPQVVSAQSSPAKVQEIGIGFGVDTVWAPSSSWVNVDWQRPLADIFTRWKMYLTGALQGKADKSYWSKRAQALGPVFDLSSISAYQGFRATVIAIRPAVPGDSSEYVIQTLFATADAETGVVRPLAITRVYVAREDGSWKFSNALDVLTRDWPKHRVGGITFVSSPDMPFDNARAMRAASFADSLADAFGVPRILHLNYFVTGSAEEENRLLGLDWMIGSGDNREGRALAFDSLLFSGDPQLGEAYLHELSHVVLAPLFTLGKLNGLASEGVATWAGGSSGFDYHRLMGRYRVFLLRNPAITLDSALTQGPVDRGARPAAALLCQMAYDHGGIPSVKALITAKPSLAGLRSAAEAAIGMPWVQISREWQARATSGR